MKRSPADGSEGSAWIPLLGVVVQLAALGLCSWAMSTARNKGRELPGGTTPSPSAATAATPPPAPPQPPFATGAPSWSPTAPKTPPSAPGAVPPPVS